MNVPSPYLEPHRCTRALPAKAACALALLLLASAAPAVDSTVYIQEDALIGGSVMHTFSSDDQTVNVILGEFSLVLGKRTVTGRDAVMWIRQQKVGSDTYRDIELYVEGEPKKKAKIVEPGRNSTDRLFLITFHQQGLLRARVASYSNEPAADLPVYKNALAERQRRQEMALAAKRAAELATRPVQPAEQVEVEEISYESDTQGQAEPEIATAAGAGATTATGPTTGTRPTATGPATRRVTTATARTPRRPVVAATRPARVFQPVNFLPAGPTTIVKMPDPRDPNREILVTVVRGGVYLSQGDPDSELFLSLQAQSAVVYYDPSAQAGAATGPARGQIIGVYLKGDVILRRGERTVEASELYYDFENGRATLLDVVFRTVQEQRNIPIYIRAAEARQLAARQQGQQGRTAGYDWYFRDTVLTTSDFYTPNYAFVADRGWFRDKTEYDEKGVALTEQRWRTRLENTTFRLNNLPLLWFPWLEGDAEQGSTAIRSAQIGKAGRLGWGFESEWFLFRLLGLPRPAGVDGELELDWYEHGFLIGPRIEYAKERYSGSFRAYGLLGGTGDDVFGTERRFEAPDQRGWVQWRHQQFLAQDMRLQAELSYACDRHFLEEFYPGTYWADKEQETLLYLKEQPKDKNWVLSALGKWRVNGYMNQTEAYPELSGYLISQPLGGGIAYWDADAHLGLLRYRAGEEDNFNPMFGIGPAGPGNGTVARADTRQAVDAPLALGPVRLLPSLTGRATYWSDTPGGGGLIRPWGQGAVDALTQIWRVYDQADSRLWNVHRLRHVIEPHGGVFWDVTDVQPEELWPLTPQERYVRDLGGGTMGVRNLWQTKRGPDGDKQSVDWLRWNISASLFDEQADTPPADGRHFFYRPEYSINRDSVNTDVAWAISDATSLLADLNYDIRSGNVGRGNIGLAVQRDPRLKYYAGLRYIGEVDSSVGTFGVNYQLNRKYELSFFEQYDFKLDGGRNNVTSISIIRRFPRFFTAVTFMLDESQDTYSVVFSLWPEGVPEARLGGNRLGMLQAASERK